LIAESLSPGARMGEILFGLIMTLTFTLSAGVMFGGEPGAVDGLLLAAVGCNVAWGLIDAVLYLLGTVFDRSRLHRLRRAVAGSSDAEASLALVAGEFDPMLEPVTEYAHRLALYREIVLRVQSEPLPRVQLGRADALAGIAIFWSVFLASIPAAIPFLLIEDAWTALRVSNLILIVLLFFVGFRWARYTNLNPWAFGLGLMLLGTLLVAIAIPLGG
jgi:VIT1/CCC1 family predicted Fe2+/Mn2+ transporter